MHQTIGEGEVAREDGTRATTKEEWPKEQEIRVMPVLTVDRWDTMPEIVCKSKEEVFNPTSSTLTMTTRQRPLQKTRSPISDRKSTP